MTDLAMPLLLLVLCSSQADGPLQVARQEDVPPGFVSQIGPDLAIVTELGSTTPYVGQQFSIIYWLRASRPPAAVDVDPQQFSACWTEAVPVSPDAPSSIRAGRGYFDYLLRQVVAFPLVDGPLSLPPLSVKIKRSGTLSAGRDDWDLAAASQAAELNVRSVPHREGMASNLPLVGEVRGTFREGPALPYPWIALELEGTANLALFEPPLWLYPPGATKTSARLMNAESIPRVVDTGGHRRISLLKRQRWSLRWLGGDNRGTHATARMLPVFNPSTGSWIEVLIPGGENTGSAHAPPLPPGVSSRSAPPSPHRLRRTVEWGALLLALSACAGIAGMYVVRRRASGKRQTGAALLGELADLERRSKASPQSFLDGAHKLLRRYARQNHREQDLGEGFSLLDNCWRTVQQYRFSAAPAGPDVREELLTSLRSLAGNLQPAAPRTDPSPPGPGGQSE